MAGLTKAQIAEREAERQRELDTLRTQLVEAQEREKASNARAEWYETMDRGAATDVDQFLEPEPAPLAAPAAPVAALPEDDAKVVYDPYDSQNPHKILADPPGFKLGWKNPLYRDGHRGWRGWRVVEHDSEIGRNLKRYLLDPPRRMEHAVDNYVRRGDSVLCFLERDIWEARQKRRTDLAARRAGAHAQDMRVDRIRGEADLQPLPPSANRVGGRSMTS